MPLKSEAQRKYMYANKPDLATKWQRESGAKSQLPERASKKKKKSSSLLDAYVAGGKRLKR
jgi:hypothetical protein